MAEPFIGEVLRDAQGNPIASESRKRVSMRIDKEQKLVKAAFRVANVRSPILSLGELIRDGCDLV